ncbi:aspartokinase [Grosmannia clavigera kw1407]|uniref:Aspartokinase n=1 Tax=Grosmannia clavigera (strain kw1407 / UAMH 11150) TaxID=655863 RepID=F0X9W2_GROCL|nr:aspartokinase [Grosmannia clavigera kw1407]EFX05582.1 aspartokinase [Grosmannia clavigera kw1407]
MYIETSDKEWLVQKYGGTSLGKLLEPICGNIIPSFLETNRLAIVCSALSGTTKATGTTSLLLQCILAAEAGHRAQGQLTKTIDLIAENHIRVLDHELSPRSKDRVISLGEKLSCIIVAAVLTSKGIPAQAVSLDDIVESVFGPAVLDQKDALQGLNNEFYHLLSKEIARRCHGCEKKVPVVTGFFGIMPDSLLKSVGRGYSDLCAAMCALGLGAIELQIWKEVDGIFTADPRKVPSARLLSTVTAEEAAELTFYGSEVIHPLTMDQIRYANIPLRLKNVFNPSGQGTVIYPSRLSPPSTPYAPLTQPSRSDVAGKERTDAVTLQQNIPAACFMLENGYHGENQIRRRPTAVTIKEPITMVNVACNRNTRSQGFLVNVFSRLDDGGISADIVTTSERTVSFAMQGHPDSAGEETGIGKWRKLKGDLEKFGKVSLLK